VSKMTTSLTVLLAVLSCQITSPATFAQLGGSTELKSTEAERAEQKKEDVLQSIVELENALRARRAINYREKLLNARRATVEELKKAGVVPVVDDFTWYQLGQGYEELGDLKRAQDCYAEALRLVKYRAFDKFRSIDQYERAVRRVESRRANLALMAGYEASTLKADLDKAVSHYKESLAILESPTTWWYLALAYHKKHMVSEALEAYKNATGRAEFPWLENQRSCSTESL